MKLVSFIDWSNQFLSNNLIPTLTSCTLDIRNNSQLNGLNVPDASLVSVSCTQDVLELMRIGQNNRAVGATALNERSSRSHRYRQFICWFWFIELWTTFGVPYVSEGLHRSIHILTSTSTYWYGLAYTLTTSELTFTFNIVVSASCQLWFKVEYV